VSEYVELVRVEAESVHIVEERIVAADSEHSVTVTQLDPLSLIWTVYEVIARPPLSEGAFQSMTTFVPLAVVVGALNPEGATAA